MKKKDFEKATGIIKQIDALRKHREALVESNIKNGGNLIFTYNSHVSDVPLQRELYAKNFFEEYLKSLDNKIEELEKEFETL